MEQLPEFVLCFILAYLPYQIIANLRNVSVKFDSACKVMLNWGFKIVKNEVNKCVTKVKAIFDNFHHRRRTAETSSLPTGDIPDCLPSVSDRLRYHFTCVFRNHLRDTRDRLRCLEGKIEVQRRRETETVAEKL